MSELRLVKRVDHQPGAPAHTDLMQRLSPFATTKTCRRGDEICSQGHPAGSWHRLLSGIARHYGERADGRRQIIDLLLPGDFFGFTPTSEYGYTVDAAVDGTKVASFPRQQLELLANTDPNLAREIRQVTFETLARVQAQLLTLGRITAPEKVGTFLLELASRSSERCKDSIKLTISRHDIADYLALSVETVSRSLTNLKNRGAIRLLSARTIVIVDRSTLDHWQRRKIRLHSASGTRRTAASADEPIHGTGGQSRHT